MPAAPAESISQWWQTFFDDDYIRVWSGFMPPEQAAEQAEGIWNLLQLTTDGRVLDAPCGYGRLSLPLAQRGAIVVGVDQSEALLKHAESARGDVAASRLRYVRHDLRKPFAETGFDAAINVFTSLGYGTEEEDVAILRTLRAAVRVGGVVLVESMHRDAAVAFLSRSSSFGRRLPDGTLLVEEPKFDAITGHISSTWHWSGPSGTGQKFASIRLYSATEYVRLIERAGLRFRSAHRGCSPEPFTSEGSDMGGRLVLLAERVDD